MYSSSLLRMCLCRKFDIGVLLSAQASCHEKIASVLVETLWLIIANDKINEM